MSKYTKPEDFIERTKQNLILYLEQKDKNYEFEVTQILNSFLGIIILPFEKQMTVTWTTVIPDDLQRKMTPLPPHKQPSTLGELCEELRNTVAHINFLTDIILNETERIEKLTFKNYRMGTTILKFEMILSIEDILKIFNMICSELKIPGEPISLLPIKV